MCLVQKVLQVYYICCYLGQHPLPAHCTYSQERWAMQFQCYFSPLPHLFVFLSLCLALLLSLCLSLALIVVTRLGISWSSRLFLLQKGCAKSCLLFSKPVSDSCFSVLSKKSSLVPFPPLYLSLSLCTHQNTVFNLQIRLEWCKR